MQYEYHEYVSNGFTKMKGNMAVSGLLDVVSSILSFPFVAALTNVVSGFCVTAVFSLCTLTTNQ